MFALCIPASLLFAQAGGDDPASLAQAAKAAESRGDYKAAVANYRELTKLAPDNPQLLSNLGIALYLDGESTAALTELQKAGKLAPNLFAPHLFAGLSWFRLGKPNQAEPELVRALRINNTDPVAHLWLGYVHMEQSRYEQAAKQLQAVLSAQTDNIDALYALGKTYLALGREKTSELLKLAPDGGRAWQLAAEQCRMRGDLTKARDLYKGAYQRRPDAPELREAVRELDIRATPIANGSKALPGEDDLFHEARNFESMARESFERIGRTAPDSYRAHQILADSFAAQGRSEDAIAEYRAVLQRKPDLPGIHQAIGTQLLETARIAEAIGELQAELKMQQQSAAAHVALARALLASGNTAAAEKELRSAARLDHPPAEMFKLLGKIELGRSDFPEAIQNLEQFLKSTPGDPSAHYLLARAYRAIGRQAASRREIEEYNRLSIDAKNRTAAQQAIEALNHKPDEGEEK